MTEKRTDSNTSSTRTLKRSVEWPVFQESLAKTLKSMREDEFLVISQKGSNRFVQFASQGAFGTRVETTSNAYLSEKNSLDRHLALLALGWNAPSGRPDEATPGNDPDGSPNYFIDFPAETPVERIAALSVHTLADLYGIAHPGNLEYDAFDKDNTPIQHKNLKIQSVRSRRSRSTDPSKQLLKAVIAATGIHDLEYDEDEHLCLRYEELGVFVTLTNDASSIRIISAMATEITPSDALLGIINELNAEPKPLRFFVHEDCVMAMHIIPAQPIVDSHVAKALVDFGRQALEAIPKLATALLTTTENASSEALTLH